MRPIACALLCLCLARPAAARLQAIVVEWGETAVELAPQTDPQWQGHGLAPANLIRGTTYLNHSDHIEAKLCRHFGVTATIVWDPDDAVPETLLVRVRHPLFTREDGATSTEDDFPTGVNRVGARRGTSNAGFGFDYRWELAPGVWTMEVVHEGEVLAAKQFTVTLPPPGAPLSACEGPPTS